VALVCPPAPERAGDVWELLGSCSPQVLIVCADEGAAVAWAESAPPEQRVHAVTGLARSASLLKTGALHPLAGAPKDLAALAQRSALKLQNVSTILVAWPEALIAGEHAGTLDTLLGEAREARRIVLTWNPGLLGDFLERHARRAEMVGSPPVDQAGAQLPPVCRARYAVVTSAHAVAARDCLDALNVSRPFVWVGGPITPPDTRPGVVLCTALPTRDELALLARLGEPVVLIRAAQLPYLRSIAILTPFSLPSRADRARDRAEALRERVARRLTEGTVDAELALLDPLFERFDPAEVAAALLALERDTGSEMRDASVPEPGEVERVKVFVSAGKKDRVAAKDLVGALVREVGLGKGDLGRIEIRESFSLVEVAASAVQRALQGLSGATIRGRRVVARLDRDV
jgi:DbpA RNA binding domain